MMKMLTYSGMASARLKANKRGYLSLAIGVFLSIFLITTFVFGVYGIVNAQLHNRQEKVGIVDMVVLDNEIMNDEKLMELGAFDQLGHAYVTGSVEGSSLHLGYYDAVGAELLCLSPTAGRLPQAPGEIALEPSALEVLELEKAIGDTVELSIIPVDGVAEARTFTIVGFLPEKSQHLDVVDKPGVNQFPAIVTCETEPAFATGRVGIHRVIKLKDGVSLGNTLEYFFLNTHPDMFNAAYGLTFTGMQRQSYSTLNEVFWGNAELMELISMAAVLAGALILSCGIGISGAMDGVLSKRREEIGVLRALGATRRQIRRMYGRENLILALLVSPVAVLAGCLAAWFLSLITPDFLRFGLKLWLILPIIAFSVITILLSGYLPLVRASKLMPMSVIRDTRMLRRSKKLKSQKTFSAPRLIATRQIRLNPTRQLGTSLLIGLMLLCCGLVCSLMAVSSQYSFQNSPTFFIQDTASAGLSGDVPIYETESLQKQSIQQIKRLDHVKSVVLDREMSVYVDLPLVPQYAGLNTIQEQFWMLPDDRFAEAMSAIGEENWWYWDDRNTSRKKYLDFIKRYDFEGDAFRTAIVTIDPTGNNLEELRKHLGEGSIDVDALNTGETVLVYAPDVWVEEFGHGSYSFHTSQESLEHNSHGGTISTTATNDCFYLGQYLPIIQLYQTEFEGAVTQIEKTVRVSGIIKELPDSLDTWSITAIITTEQGLENMGFRIAGLHSISIYTDELAQQQEHNLQRKLESIVMRTNGYNIDNWAEDAREMQAYNRRMLLLFVSIIIVFFSVAVGMIVSSVTRQLHNEGRTIGMLRAVGADEKAILGCYSGQLNAAILGGLGVTGAVYILFLIFSALDAIGNPWFRIRLSDILQWAAVLGLTLAVAAACWDLSRFILGLRIREILKKSIIDNIREL